MLSESAHECFDCFILAYLLDSLDKVRHLILGTLLKVPLIIESHHIIEVSQLVSSSLQFQVLVSINNEVLVETLQGRNLLWLFEVLNQERGINFEERPPLLLQSILIISLSGWVETIFIVLTLDLSISLPLTFFINVVVSFKFFKVGGSILLVIHVACIDELILV